MTTIEKEHSRRPLPRLGAFDPQGGDGARKHPAVAAWEAFLCELYRRGLKGEGLKLISVDGGKGLLAALPIVYPTIPVQR